MNEELRNITQMVADLGSRGGKDQDSLIQEIEDGRWDRLIRAISERQAKVAVTNGASTLSGFTAGDRVRVPNVASIRPTYLAGAMGVVDDIRGTKVIVKFDEDSKPAKRGKPMFRMRPTSLVKV